MECEAVLSIIDNCGAGDWSYLSSDVLLDEILETSDNDKREKVMLLYHAASEHIGFTEAIFARAKELEQFNIKSFDALHLASAETARADVLLTTDRRFINAAKRSGTNIPVLNPLVWLAEVLYDRES
jgi:predicted nucleic acid-binding protein